MGRNWSSRRGCDEVRLRNVIEDDDDGVEEDNGVERERVGG